MVSEVPSIPDGSITHACRLVMLGAAESGKSSLVSQFTYHDYLDEYVPTSLDIVCSLTEVDGLSYNVKITDCCADESFAQQRETYLRNADLVVLVYSVTDEKSLEFLRTAVQQARDAQMYTRKGFFPIFVVGTHADVTGAERKVSRKRGEEVAREICLAHAELIRPLFLRTIKGHHDDPVQTGVGVLAKRVWQPSSDDVRYTSPTAPPALSSLSSSPLPEDAAALPAGASSTVPFMEVSTRDGEAVSTLFAAIIRLHVIASAFHDLHMPVKSTPVTSPITIAAAAAAAGSQSGGGGSGDRWTSSTNAFPMLSPASVNSAVGLGGPGSSSGPAHQRTFSTASSSANGGASAAVMEMSVSMNCLPSPLYLYTPHNTSPMGTYTAGTTEAGSVGNSGGSAGGAIATAAKTDSHHDPCKALGPRTPHSTSFASLNSQSNAMEEAGAGRKGGHGSGARGVSSPPSRLSLSPTTHALVPAKATHSEPMSPTSPQLLASTRIPIERLQNRPQNNSGQDPSTTPTPRATSATPRASPSTTALPAGTSPSHSQGTTPRVHRPKHSEGASTHDTSPRRRDKSGKGTKEKCLTM